MKRRAIRFGSETITLTREERCGEKWDMHEFLERVKADDATVLPELFDYLADALDVPVAKVKRLTYPELFETIADFCEWLRAPATPQSEAKRQSRARSRSK